MDHAVSSLELIGGWSCLDFANTLGWHEGELREEFLNCYSDLIEWGRHAGIISGSEKQRLRKLALNHPSEAEKALKDAKELREAICRIFSSAASHTPQKPADLAAFNKYLSKTMASSRMVTKGFGFEWNSDGDRESLDWILNLITRSAFALMTDDELLKRVKKCADDRGCGWLFLDHSRNRSRLWCSMQDCGNRAKQMRFYNRRKEINV